MRLKGKSRETMALLPWYMGQVGLVHLQLGWTKPATIPGMNHQVFFLHKICGARLPSEVETLSFQGLSSQDGTCKASPPAVPRLTVQCEAPKIAKLVNITPITMVYGIYNYSYWGESKPTYNVWGPHIVTVEVEGLNLITSVQLYKSSPLRSVISHLHK